MAFNIRFWGLIISLFFTVNLFGQDLDGISPASSLSLTNKILVDQGTRSKSATLTQLQALIGGGGGASNLDGLSDVVITTPSTGQLVRFNGTNWVNVSLIASDIPALDWSKITTGKPTTLAGYGITNAIPITGTVLNTPVSGAIELNSNGYLSSNQTGNDFGKGYLTLGNNAITGTDFGFLETAGLYKQVPATSIGGSVEVKVNHAGGNVGNAFFFGDANNTSQEAYIQSQNTSRNALVKVKTSTTESSIEATATHEIKLQGGTVNIIGATTLQSLVGVGNRMLVANSDGLVSTQSIPSSGTPAGSTGQVQFNNAGAFGANANLHWDNTNNRLGIRTAIPDATLHIKVPSGGFLPLIIQRPNDSSGDLMQMKGGIDGNTLVASFNGAGSLSTQGTIQSDVLSGTKKGIAQTSTLGVISRTTKVVQTLSTAAPTDNFGSGLSTVHSFTSETSFFEIGDAVHGRYYGYRGSPTAVTKQLTLSFAGTTILSESSNGSTTVNFEVEFWIQWTSATTASAFSRLTNDGVSQVTKVNLTGLTIANAQALTLQLQSTATGHWQLEGGKILYEPN